MFKTKEQSKFPEKEISNLPDRESKAMLIKMLTNLGRTVEEHNKNFNTEIENKRK